MTLCGSCGNLTDLFWLTLTHSVQTDDCMLTYSRLTFSESVGRVHLGSRDWHRVRGYRLRQADVVTLGLKSEFYESRSLILVAYKYCFFIGILWQWNTFATYLYDNRGSTSQGLWWRNDKLSCWDFSMKECILDGWGSLVTYTGDKWILLMRGLYWDQIRGDRDGVCQHVVRSG